jgi:hypothetical protein
MEGPLSPDVAETSLWDAVHGSRFLDDLVLEETLKGDGLRDGDHAEAKSYRFRAQLRLEDLSEAILAKVN